MYRIVYNTVLYRFLYKILYFILWYRSLPEGSGGVLIMYPVHSSAVHVQIDVLFSISLHLKNIANKNLVRHSNPLKKGFRKVFKFLLVITLDAIFLNGLHLFYSNIQNK